MTFRTFAIAPLALGLALPLALGACNKQDDAATAGLSGAAIAKIAAPVGKSWAETVVATPEGGYRMGNPEAPIKLIEFGSLTCSHCMEFSEKGSVALRDTFVASGRVSYEFRNFIRDPIDLTAAQLTHCGTPESFFALTDQVFGYQATLFEKAQAAGKGYEAAVSQAPDRRGLAIADMVGLTEFFAARGIARDQAATCLADTAKAKALADATNQQAEQYKIEGTPTFLVNGTKVDMNTWEQVKAELERLGAR